MWSISESAFKGLSFSSAPPTISTYSPRFSPSKPSDKRKFTGCDHVYLPITMEALQTEKTPAVTPRVWLEGSMVHSNFYIAATQIEGEPVYTQVAQSWHDYREFPVTSVELAKTHGLQGGSYTAQVHLSNGQTETVQFTV